jgi:hypothetical protein
MPDIAALGDGDATTSRPTTTASSPVAMNDRVITRRPRPPDRQSRSGNSESGSDDGFDAAATWTTDVFPISAIMFHSTRVAFT